MYICIFVCGGTAIINGQWAPPRKCFVRPLNPATASIIRHCTFTHPDSTLYVIFAECCVIRLAFQSPVCDKTKTNYENYKRNVPDPFFNTWNPKSKPPDWLWLGLQYLVAMYPLTWNLRNGLEKDSLYKSRVQNCKYW